MDKNKANTTEKRQGAGRPKIYVDTEILKNLASIGCPDYEIASVTVSYTHLTLPTKRIV